MLDFLSVLIQAGEIKNFLAKALPRTRNHVGDDLLIGVPQMWLAIYVIDGSGNVELFAQGREL